MVMFTTGEAAGWVGVHDSSIKRWCDAGKLPCALTEGGHRRIALGDLLTFAERNDLVCPLLALRPWEAEVVEGVQQAEQHQEYAALVDLTYRWLVDDEAEYPARLFQLLLEREVPLHAFCDGYVAPVMHRIGKDWEQGVIDVGDEHRMSHVVLEGLQEVRKAMRVEASSPSQPVAIVGCAEGNQHEIGAQMVRLLLEAHGWHVIYLGADVPTEDFALQQRKHAASLVCVSLTPPHVASDVPRLLHALASFYTPQQPYRIALGGSAAQGASIAASSEYPFDAYHILDSIQALARSVQIPIQS